MTVYIDELFFINLVINYLLLLSCAMLCGTAIRRTRFLFGAALGACYACLIFFPELGPLYTVWGKAAFSLLMSLASYGYQGMRAFLRRSFVFYVVSFAFGGAMTALFRLAPAGGGALRTGLSAPVLIAVSLGAYVLMALFLRGAPKLSERAPPRARVEITLFGKSVELEAMVDTGNRLQDPMTNERVVVAEYRSVRSVLPHDVRAILDVFGVADAAGTLRMLADAGLAERFRLLPFSAVGTKTGLLLVLRADSVRSGEHTTDGAPVALTETDLREETGCCAVIGA